MPNSSQSSDDRLDSIDRILAVIDFIEWLIRDCAENQRILVDKQFNWIQLIIECIQLSNEFIDCLILTKMGTKLNDFEIRNE